MGREIVRRALALLAFAALPASGQVVIGGGVYGGYAPYPYGPYGPLPYGGFATAPYGVYAPHVVVDPWATTVPRLPDVTPACYRYGRCSPAEVAAYRRRAEQLDRLAPSAPADPGAAPRYGPSPMPPPTAEEDILPEYRASSRVREEYRDSGRPIDGRK
jgi:hypothetical protein